MFQRPFRKVKEYSVFHVSLWGVTLIPPPRLVLISCISAEHLLRHAFPITINRKAVSYSFPHVSHISPLDMLHGWKPVRFSSGGICSISSALYPHGNLFIIIKKPYKRLWNGTNVGKRRYLGLFVFALPPLLSCCRDTG